jgi:hypothetical protein
MKADKQITWSVNAPTWKKRWTTASTACRFVLIPAPIAPQSVSKNSHSHKTLSLSVSAHRRHQYNYDHYPNASIKAPHNPIAIACPHHIQITSHPIQNELHHLWGELANVARTTWATTCCCCCCCRRRSIQRAEGRKRDRQTDRQSDRVDTKLLAQLTTLIHPAWELIGSNWHLSEKSITTKWPGAISLSDGIIGDWGSGEWRHRQERCYCSISSSSSLSNKAKESKKTQSRPDAWVWQCEHDPRKKWKTTIVKGKRENHLTTLVESENVFSLSQALGPFLPSLVESH